MGDDGQADLIVELLHHGLVVEQESEVRGLGREPELGGVRCVLWSRYSDGM